jgi:AP-2 complex subunit alpha
LGSYFGYENAIIIKLLNQLSDSPTLNLSFRYNGKPQTFNIKLPLSLNKFFEPTEMNGESFFARWKNLGG